MHVVELQVANVKRVRAVLFAPRPGAGVVIVRGPNGAGKSSVIDAIAYAIGGQRLICAEPLRTGQSSGFARVHLGDVEVTRRWARSSAGEVTSTLEVRGRDGIRLARPQAALDGLFAALSFDPLAFTRENAARQLELVQQMVGLDFAELDRRRASLYEDRTALGREMRGAQTEAERRPLHEGLPSTPLELSALAAELERASASQAAALRAGEAAAWHLQQRATTEASLQRVRAQIAQVRQQLAGLESQEAELDTLWHQQDAELEIKRTATRRVQDGAIDPEPLRVRLQQAEKHNALIRENQQRAELHKRAAALRQQHEDLSEQIASIALEKERAAAAAQLPVPGLTFRHDGLLLDGVPFEQASQAQQIRVSVAMGAALQPELRVLLVRDGSLLGDEALTLLAQLAAERDLQVWVERVGEPGEGAGAEVLVIEDGERAQASAA